MLEEERKYAVDARFTMPDLTDCLPEGGRLIAKPQQRLRATYHDTTDLRLARAGASLRYRRGDDEPWTVKLPTGTPGIRHEISEVGAPSAVPARLLELVTAHTRGAPVAPVAVLSTVRRAHQILDAEDTVLVEIVDDAVSVLEEGRVRLKFRELEVERKRGKAKLLDRVERTLTAAGATPPQTFTPKLARALGAAAAEPGDWPEPPGRLPRKATAGEVVTAALRRDIARIVAHDPLVRLRAPVGDNDTAVHQMRVGCRKLRSDLRTFSLVLDEKWAASLRTELSWLADALGTARDAEVLRARLRRTAALDPLEPLDEAAVARIDADLAARHEDALNQLDTVLRDERYLSLLETLLATTREPRLSGRADEPAASLLPRLVGKPWHRLATGGRRVVGAGQLDPRGSDDVWHAVRIRGKQARYAADAVAGVLGGEAAELATALGHVQELLGEHQDAVTAAQTWLAIANADPDDHALAVTAGRLYERERASVRSVRAAFPDAWRTATASRLTMWLR